MLRNRSTGSSLSSGSTAASIKSEYDSEDYETLLIVRKLLVFKSFGSIYLPVDQNNLKPIHVFFFSNFQEGVLIFATYHFITLIRKSYFAE